LILATTLCVELLSAVRARTDSAAHVAPGCKADAGLTLLPGFCVGVFANNVGHARHRRSQQPGVGEYPGRRYHD
jgi:hypothetical protein